MLRQMRENFKALSWTLWAVIIVFIGGFIVFSGGSFGNGATGNDIILTVGNVSVTGTTFHHQLLRTSDSLRSRYGDISKQIIRQQNLPARIMQDYINSAIIENEADAKNLVASKHEIVEKIKSMPGLQRDGKFIGVEQYKRVLAANRIPYPEFEKSVIKEVKAAKLRELVTAGIVIGDKELKESYKKEKDSAELEVITLSADSVKDKITNSDAELQEYYNKHKENFKTAERRSALAVTFKYKDFNKELKLNEDNYYNFYKENKKNYIEPAKTKVSRIFLPYKKEDKDKVKKSADELQKKLTKANFAEMAKKDSKDEKAKTGGDWGYWEWKNKLEASEQNVIKRSPQGHIAIPVDTGSGYAILLVTEKKSEKQQSYVAVKEAIKTRMNREALSKIVKEKIDALYAKVKETKDFAAAMKTAGLKTVAIDKVKAGDVVKDVDNFGYLTRSMFSLKKGAVSNPVQFADGMALISITDIIAPAVKPFEQAKADVSKSLTDAKKLELLKTQATELASAIKSAKSEKAVAGLLKKKGLEFKKETYRRGDRIYSLGEIKGLDNKIFSMSNDQITAPLEFNNSYAIIKVKEMKLSTDDQFKKDKSSFYDEQLKMKKGVAFGNYIMSVRDKYNVQFNQPLFTEISTRFMGSTK